MAAIIICFDFGAPNNKVWHCFHCFPIYHYQRDMHECLLSCFSHVQLSVTLWTVTHQAPLSMGFSRQEYWSGLPCPSPGDLRDPGIEPMSLMSPALSGGFFTTSATWEALSKRYGANLLSYIMFHCLGPIHCHHISLPRKGGMNIRRLCTTWLTLSWV